MYPISHPVPVCSARLSRCTNLRMRDPASIPGQTVTGRDKGKERHGLWTRCRPNPKGSIEPPLPRAIFIPPEKQRVVYSSQRLSCLVGLVLYLAKERESSSSSWRSCLFSLASFCVAGSSFKGRNGETTEGRKANSGTEQT